MILLDTDHLTVLKYTDSERYARLHGRLLAAAPELIGTTIVNVEEQMRGWLSAIAKERTLLRQITAYRELTDLFDFFAKLNIISLSAEAVDLFNGFRKSGVKIGYHGSEDGLYYHSPTARKSGPRRRFCRASASSMRVFQKRKLSGNPARSRGPGSSSRKKSASFSSKARNPLGMILITSAVGTKRARHRIQADCLWGFRRPFVAPRLVMPSSTSGMFPGSAEGPPPCPGAVVYRSLERLDRAFKQIRSSSLGT